MRANLRNLLLPLLVGVYCLSIGGCAMDGRREISIADETGAPLDQILVIPLYVNSFVVNIGIEGKPVSRSYDEEAVITKPFQFNSGEDIMAKKIASRGVIVPIPPFAYSGNSHTIYRYLMIKNGYQPIVLSHYDVASKRLKPMARATSNSGSSAIQLLISPTPDQDALKSLMEAGDLKQSIHVHFEAEDVSLLKSYQ